MEKVILISQSSADFIEVRESFMRGPKSVAIKAVGYPNYTTTHLSREKVLELIEALQELIK